MLPTNGCAHLRSNQKTKVPFLCRAPLIGSCAKRPNAKASLTTRTWSPEGVFRQGRHVAEQVESAVIGNLLAWARVLKRVPSCLAQHGFVRFHRGKSDNERGSQFHHLEFLISISPNRFPHINLLLSTFYYPSPCRIRSYRSVSGMLWLFSTWEDQDFEHSISVNIIWTFDFLFVFVIQLFFWKLHSTLFVKMNNPCS